MNKSNKDTYTIEEYKNMTKINKKNKYRNIVVKDTAGHKISDSAGELRRYEELKMLEKYGEIKNLEFQKKFVLQDSFIDNENNKIRKITYIADFVYEANGITIIEDYKSSGFSKGKKWTSRTEAFNIKLKLLQYKLKDYKNIKIIIFDRKNV